MSMYFSFYDAGRCQCLTSLSLNSLEVGNSDILWFFIRLLATSLKRNILLFTVLVSWGFCNNHKRGGLKTTEIYSHSSGGQKSKTKMLAGTYFLQRL